MFTLFTYIMFPIASLDINDLDKVFLKRPINISLLYIDKILSIVFD